MDLTNLQNLDVKTKKDAITDNGIPGFLPKSSASGGMDKMRIRYQKFDLDELGDVSELEKIMTKSIRNQGVFILSKKDFIFMDRMFMLVEYMEEVE